jgi:SAM-dependent methyltransferase
VSDRFVETLCGSCGLAMRVPVTDRESLRCGHCGHCYAFEEGVLQLGRDEATDDYPEDLHDLLATAEARHFWFGERNRTIVQTLRETAGELDGKLVLDVGCGRGFVLAALERAGMTGCGLEMHQRGLAYARRKTRGLLVCDSAAHLPFTAQFDLVTLCDVIEHVDDDVALLRQARDVLAAGGSVLVTVPAHPALWSAVDGYSGHKRRYTRSSLIAVLQSAGLAVRAVRYFGSLLLLPQAAFRLRPAAGKQDRDSVLANEFRVPPAPLNGALRLAMSADRLLSRLPVTFGTSLIAIAGRA